MMTANQVVLISIPVLIQKILKKCKNKARIIINDVRRSPHATKRKHLVELLMIRDGQNKHFLTIRSISRLLSGSKYDFGMNYCKKCYCSFKAKQTIENIHTPLCTDFEKVLPIMPEIDKIDIVKFKDHHMKIMQPFMIVADFETFTDIFKSIKPYSFGMFTHCFFNKEKNKLTQHTGDNCLDNFFGHLITHVDYIDKSKAKTNPHSNPNV